MAHQRPWNKYEVALLIECYINVTEKGRPLEDELIRLSTVLRQMAINTGLEIDEVYRNFNGMHWQYGFMKATFEGAKNSGNPSKLFFDMVALYKNDTVEFHELLEEAHRLSGRKETETMSSEETKQHFFNWLCSIGIQQVLSKSWVDCLCHVSQYALSHSISKVDFWQIQDYHDFNRIRSLLLGNRAFKFSHPLDFRAFDKAGKMYSDYIKKHFDLPSKSPSKPELMPIVDAGKHNAKQTADDKSEKAKENQSINQSSCPAPVSSEERVSLYSEWLIQDRHLSGNTVANYTASLKGAEIYATEHGILSESLITAADETLAQAVDKLLSDEEFSVYNSVQHNRFSAALNSYLIFRLGEESASRRLPRTRKQYSRLGNSEQKIFCPADLRGLLVKKFPYGIRTDSSIDIMKLRGFAEVFRVEVSEDEELLKSQIAAGGDLFEGKIYFIEDNTLSEMVSRVQAIFDTGVCVIYYDKLYDFLFSWFDEHRISSPDHARELLKNHMKNVFCSRNFIRNESNRINELEAVEGEFIRVWGNQVTHTYEEIYELLPYIPEDKVRFYLSRSNNFVWSASETFAWLDKVVISNEEKDEIWQYVDSMCEATGFASISEVPLGSIIEENYEISISAIYDAIYRIVLAEHFQINGKILTRMDMETDALTLTKAYCSGKDECLLSGLNNYVISITGTSGRQTAFRAAYDQMVRVTKERFVADEAIQFDIDAIDDLLDEFIKGDFISIKGIATFVMFPGCGQIWNHYVLESFCYRFSKKYRLEVINFNDKNAGIIVKKECALSYSDMLASAVAYTEIALTEENVGRYLCDNGYTAKSKMTILSEVTEKAQELRRQGR